MHLLSQHPQTQAHHLLKNITPTAQPLQSHTQQQHPLLRRTLDEQRTSQHGGEGLAQHLLLPLGAAEEGGGGEIGAWKQIQARRTRRGWLMEGWVERVTCGERDVDPVAEFAGGGGGGEGEEELVGEGEAAGGDEDGVDGGAGGFGGRGERGGLDCRGCGGHAVWEGDVFGR